MLNMTHFSCAQASQIWGQAVHSAWSSCVGNRRLHTGRGVLITRAVCKLVENVLVFTRLTHILSHHLFVHFTDASAYLSTLSTPPITTTTKYIKI